MTVEGNNVVQNGQPLNFTVTAKAGDREQGVKGMHVKFVQKTTSTQRSLKGGSTKSTKTSVLAEKREGGFTLKPGESRTMNFSLPVNAMPDGTGEAGVMGTLAKLNKMATGLHSEWEVEATAELDGSVDASEKMSVTVQF